MEAGTEVALLSICTFADRSRAAVGVNVAVTVQDPPAAKVLPQLLVCEKAPASAPISWILEKVRGAAPTFDTMIGSGALVVPTDRGAKPRTFGLMLSTATGADAPPPPPPPQAVTVQSIASSVARPSLSILRPPGTGPFEADTQPSRAQ